MPLEIRYREFLLGISDEETDRRIEEGILEGKIDPSGLRLAEDELIDEYLFGNLSPEEEEGFRSHFLATEERQQRFSFALALMRYAEQHAIPARGQEQLTRRKVLTWKGGAIAALAASIFLFAWLGMVRFRQDRASAQNQVARHQDASVPGSVPAQLSRGPEGSPIAGSPGAAPGAGQATAIMLFPLERGVPKVTAIDLPPGARSIWIDLWLPAGPGRQYIATLQPEGTTAWKQPCTTSATARGTRCTIQLPVQYLTAGRGYQISLDGSSPENRGESISYTFRVTRD